MPDTRTRSRYPRPGTLVDFWQDDPEGMTHGLAAVLATSRHKTRVTEAEALAALQDAYGTSIGIHRTATWRTVTQYDIECGGTGEADAGDWAEVGTGGAWVEVAYPTKEPDNA